MVNDLTRVETSMMECSRRERRVTDFIIVVGRCSLDILLLVVVRLLVAGLAGAGAGGLAPIFGCG